VYYFIDFQAIVGESEMGAKVMRQFVSPSPSDSLCLFQRAAEVELIQLPLNCGSSSKNLLD
jgi:hypothetical protein